MMILNVDDDELVVVCSGEVYCTKMTKIQDRDLIPCSLYLVRRQHLFCFIIFEIQEMVQIRAPFKMIGISPVNHIQKVISYLCPFQ